jgi:peptide/nickel transport system substrate-binding protein
MERRLTRRRFLAASAAGAAGAAVLAAGCGEGKRTGGATPGALPTAAVGDPKRGGVLRVYNFDALSPESFDPHAVSGGPIVNAHSAIFSKLLRYTDERAGAMAPDAADAMPEQPDELTYLFKLREGVRFHDTPATRLAAPALAGRVLTSADVRYSIERQAAEPKGMGSRFARKSQYAVIERIETPDDATVRIKLKAPTAPFLAFLAGRQAFIVPPEVIDTTSGEAGGAASMIGSGPFVLESFEAGFAVKLQRNANWFARADAEGPVRPYLDAYHAFLSPQEDTFQREAFEGRAVDATELLDPQVLDHARTTNLADIVVEEADAGCIVASRLLVDRPPFNDARVRRALHLAIDRRALVSLLYPALADEPSARLCGPVAPAATAWALTEDDLYRLPGYVEDRTQALADAKDLWSAAAGDAPLTELRISVSGAPRTFLEIAIPALERQLGEGLGVRIVPQEDPSGGALIAAGLRLNREGASEGTIAFTFAIEDGGVDLDDWVYGQFRSGEPGNTYRMQDATLDAMLDAQRAEFDGDARQQLGFDIQEYLLANVNARIEYMAPVRRRLAWGYARNYRLPLWHGSDFDLADTWLDASHPAWVGRPA